ncbi:MAG: mucoidy inhibitor MuiA family protein [Candidatus Omnitrophota bacterium]
MKKIFFILLLIFVFPLLVCAQDLVADSKINQVTVYTQGALVNRQATLKLAAGSQKIIFADIIPQIDENSLRVSGEGSARVVILGAAFKKEFLKDSPAARVKELQNQMQQINDEIRKFNNTKLVLQDKKAFLDSVRLFSNGQLPKDLVTRMPGAQELEDTLKFLDARLRDNYKELVDVELSMREAQKKLNVLARELNNITVVERKQKTSIVVDLEVSEPGDFNLKIAYRVSGANWEPLYDARANFAKSEVELISFGLVKQSSGDDWGDVEMLLSTAQINLSGNMPEVQSWFIRPYAPRPIYQDEVYGGNLKSKASMQMSAERSAMPELALGVGGAEPKRATYNFAQSEAKGVAVVYNLPGLATLKSDGSEYKLPIASQTLKGKFEYSAYPRLSPYAYLVSRVTNAPDQQLLGGRVNIFLEGDFVGQGDIKAVGPAEEFDLYLGADENVKIKRQQLEKKTDDVIIANIPSPNRKVTYKFKLGVENYKNKKIKISLFEAMPVSENEKIKVSIGSVSLVPKDKDWKDKKGIWRWELELEPKAKQEIFYTYTLECPRDMNIEGLE